MLRLRVIKQDSKRSKRASATGKLAGSVTADAAVSLPVFILSFALILSLVFQAAAEDSSYRRLSAKANAGFAVIGAVGIDVPFMMVFDKTPKNDVRTSLFYRPFVGESAQTRDENTTVYVYTKYGTRYHVRSCSTVDNNKNYEVLTKKEAEEKGYTPCRLCCEGGTDYFKSKEGLDFNDILDIFR